MLLNYTKTSCSSSGGGDEDETESDDRADELMEVLVLVGEASFMVALFSFTMLSPCDILAESRVLLFFSKVSSNILQISPNAWRIRKV